jgi:hypothetical protein
MGRLLLLYAGCLERGDGIGRQMGYFVAAPTQAAETPAYLFIHTRGTIAAGCFVTPNVRTAASTSRSQSTTLGPSGPSTPAVRTTSTAMPRITIPNAITALILAPTGVGGFPTYNTAPNLMGIFFYDNSGEPMNPLNAFFACPTSSRYYEPRLPLRPFGEFQGAAVSG